MAIEDFDLEKFFNLFKGLPASKIPQSSRGPRRLVSLEGTFKTLRRLLKSLKGNSKASKIQMIKFFRMSLEE